MANGRVATQPAPAVSQWAPMRIGIFRAVWIAALVSNLGSWMHLVAAGWLMTTLTSSAALVALLQTANALPSFALALPAGALADVLDRRRLILLTQAWQLAVAGILGVLTVTHVVNPAILLVMTFAMGAGLTLGGPAYSAITPELVPRDELPAAISMNVVSMTAAQAIGPAIGGILVSLVGPGAVFLLNAVSFLAVLGAIASWRRTPPVATLPPEHVSSAMRTGLRYTANAPEFLTVLGRISVYVLLYSSLPALLAITTRLQLHGTASSYGLLLGLLGIGGVLGGLALPQLRRRAKADQLVVGATLVLALVLIGFGQSRSTLVAAPLMVFAGFASMTCMSSLNIAVQQVLPTWIRGRGLAVFQLAFQLGFAVGAAFWGTVATRAGIGVTLTIAGVAMALSALLALRLRLSAADGVDSRPAYRDEPHVDVEVDPSDGPVLVTTEYRVPADKVDTLMEALPGLRQARAREGAMHWGLYADVERPDVHVEEYVVASWTEHKRQGERRTVSDQAAIDRATTLHTAPEPPASRYLLGHHFRARRTSDRR